jgi:hypothetical protein
MKLDDSDTRVPHPSRSPVTAVEPILHDTNRFAPLINDARRKAVLCAISIALGTGILLSGCAATRDYDSAAVYADDDASSSDFGFDSWGWRNCDCGTFGQMDRTEPNDE